MNKHFRFLLGTAIIACGLFLPKFESVFVPSEPEARVVLSIDKPSSELLSLHSGIDKVVTEKKDREVLSIFNYEFSKRLPQYETTVQNYNNVYTYAAKEIFGDSLKGKYDGLGEYLTKSFQTTLGDKDGFVTDKERKELADKFKTYSWILGGTNE
jgi:hypothetical protein